MFETVAAHQDEERRQGIGSNQVAQRAHDGGQDVKVRQHDGADTAERNAGQADQQPCSPATHTAHAADTAVVAHTSVVKLMRVPALASLAIAG